MNEFLVETRMRGGSLMITIPSSIVKYSGLEDKDWIKVIFEKIKKPEQEEVYTSEESIDSQSPL